MLKTCAVKASVSASEGDNAVDVETGGMAEVEPFPVGALGFALLKPPAGILQPIMASSAVGAFVGRLVDAVEVAVMLSD